MGKIIKEGPKPADDPLFSGGVQTFTVRRSKKKTGASAEDIDQLGREASAGMQAQSDGEDPTAVIEKMRELNDD